MSLLSRFVVTLVVLALPQIGLAVPVAITPDPVPNGATPFPFDPDFFGIVNLRYQQLTDSAAFSALGGPANLLSIDFVNAGGGGVQTTFTGATLRLGATTVTRGSMSVADQNTNFSDFASSVLVASDYTLTSIADPVFNLRLTFATPFLYNPADGNLLLDFFTPSGNGPVLSRNTFSGVSGENHTWSGGSGNNPSTGLLSRFNFNTLAVGAPELDGSAAAVPLALCAGALLLLYDRRRTVVQRA